MGGGYRGLTLESDIGYVFEHIGINTSETHGTELSFLEVWKEAVLRV